VDENVHVDEYAHAHAHAHVDAHEPESVQRLPVT
jgi:hypothetical protein